jgi:hypothetical protein
MGDIAHIQELTEEIGAQAPALASQLRVLVRRFDLRAISELIGKGSGQWML